MSTRVEQALCRELLQGCGDVCAQVCVPGGTSPERGLPQLSPITPKVSGGTVDLPM